ncbi:unnamed protein product [Allacma fusca]|uniref:Uncharacterized protein n=1 Tax=Allacma fusca TaxID=39272 RepID=A0A8J2KPP6_9HEXA|nr:unnamed protein product [Allacma fusca]
MTKRKVEEEVTVTDMKKARNTTDSTCHPGHMGQIDLIGNLLKNMENRQAMRSEEMEDRVFMMSNTPLNYITKRLTDTEKSLKGRMEELEAGIDGMEEESSSLKSQIMA